MRMKLAILLLLLLPVAAQGLTPSDFSPSSKKVVKSATLDDSEFNPIKPKVDNDGYTGQMAPPGYEWVKPAGEKWSLVKIKQPTVIQSFSQPSSNCSNGKCYIPRN